MSATSLPAPAHHLARRERLGLLLGLAGVIAFSLTLPMTRTAVSELDAWFVAFGRMAIAGVIAAVRVIGNVRLKAITPVSPSSKPSRSRRAGCWAGAGRLVALMTVLPPLSCRFAFLAHWQMSEESRIRNG